MKKDNIVDFYSNVALTEPLGRFRSGVEAILLSLGETEKIISRRQKEVKRLNEDWEDAGGMIKAWRHLTSRSLRELEQARKNVNGNYWLPNQQELEILRKDYQELYNEYVKQDLDFQTGFPDFQKYFNIALPMYFVYLMAIWDAFIIDTAKNLILAKKATNKQGFTVYNTNTKPDFSNIDETTDELVEETIQKLVKKRKSIAAVFEHEWDIEWQESGIGLPLLAELRARRNLWVHNQGKVDKKYLEILERKKYPTLKKVGDITSIDTEYIRMAASALTILAVYIHSRTNSG
jgi:hypothetical protein